MDYYTHYFISIIFIIFSGTNYIDYCNYFIIISIILFSIILIICFDDTLFTIIGLHSKSRFIAHDSRINRLGDLLLTFKCKFWMEMIMYYDTVTGPVTGHMNSQQRPWKWAEFRFVRRRRRGGGGGGAVALDVLRRTAAPAPAPETPAPRTLQDAWGGGGASKRKGCADYVGANSRFAYTKLSDEIN
jgi:hypothetical protein